MIDHTSSHVNPAFKWLLHIVRQKSSLGVGATSRDVSIIYIIAFRIIDRVFFILRCSLLLDAFCHRIAAFEYRRRSRNRVRQGLPCGNDEPGRFNSWLSKWVNEAYAALCGLFVEQSDQEMHLCKWLRYCAVQEEFECRHLLYKYTFQVFWIISLLCARNYLITFPLCLKLLFYLLYLCNTMAVILNRHGWIEDESLLYAVVAFWCLLLILSFAYT